MYVAETLEIWNFDFKMLTWSRTGVLKKIGMLDNVIFADNFFWAKKGNLFSNTCF